MPARLAALLSCYILKMGKVAMNVLQETLLHSAVASSNEREFFDSLQKSAKQLGFEYCAYGLRAPLPVSSPRVHMMNSYPDGWQRRYDEQGYIACDPTVAHALSSPTSLIWTDELFSNCREFWEDARAHGLSVGWAQPCHGPNRVVGLLTLARSCDELSSREFGSIAMQMYWVAQIAHEGMAHYLLPKIMPETSVKLSPRETEALRWTADGKTSGEVSEIMCISERTVNFHINNAVVKLCACNKTAATVKAAMLGLL